MNCLVVGYGSIGARHAAILNKLGLKVFVVSSREIKNFTCFKSIEKAFERKDYEYITICSETYLHYDSFLKLANLGFGGKLLIEKPVFSEPRPLPERCIENTFVAYNLRFHPIIQRLNELLRNKELFSIHAYAGHYLPNWRPNSDYTKCYSSSNARGGGVLRDLSHELDYINFLTGGWKRVAAIGGKFSDLQIESNDIYALLIETENCPVVSVQINYLDLEPRRDIIVNLKGLSAKADLIRNTVEINGKVSHFDVERNTTYTLQHEALLNGDSRILCTFDQAMEVLNLITSAEKASRKRTWINR